MNRIIGSGLSTAALIVLAAACSSGPRGAGEVNGMINPLTLGPPPIYALLGYRADLNLTSEQVTQLDRIAQEAQEETALLLRELEEQGRGGGRQGSMLRLDPEDEPLVEEIRAARRSASEAVAEVLTEDQETMVCNLFERNRSSAAGGRSQRAAVPIDSGDIARSGPPATWFWCASSAEDETG